MIMLNKTKAEYSAPLVESLETLPCDICTTSPASYDGLGNDGWDIVDFKW